MRFVKWVAIGLLSWSISFASSTATLKIHYLDVGNGDCEIICSPDGKNVLIDAGSKQAKCKGISDFCTSKNITQFDYVIISHYDLDHIDCIPGLASKFTQNAIVYDRGGFKNSATYDDYIKAIGTKRKTAEQGGEIALDNNKLKIKFVALNGNGIETSDENDLSLVAELHYGSFDASFGGDLPGFQEGGHMNIESSVAPLVRKIEVYKVHHHCSRTSTNTDWLQTTQPQVAILSVGPLVHFGHPTEECVSRLHDANIDCYWTEIGAGATPDSKYDHLWGNITIEVNGDGKSYTVKGSGGSKTYQSWSDNLPVATTGLYVWSKRGQTYHTLDCSVGSKIVTENRVEGSTPPPGLRPHSCIPSN
jgi:beta-lactamase superfamily II metal-dependent hydrolase